LVSRCILTRLPAYSHGPTIVGPPLDLSLWKDPRVYETELKAANV
jgi:hypothetical protein